MRQKSPFWPVRVFLIFCLLGGQPLAALAPQEVCDKAAQTAAHQSNVPLAVLLSITRVETGRQQGGQLTPWPWAANRSGQSFFFPSKSEAIAFAEDEIAQGNVNFDVGCFQINLRWHSQNFSSLDDAFDPFSNAEYAARFLGALYEEKGNWAEAVAAYHSRTDVHAKAYLAKVKAAWHAVQDAPISIAKPAETPPSRANEFPLLQAGRGENGSIVPLIAAGQSRILLP